MGAPFARFQIRFVCVFSHTKVRFYINFNNDETKTVATRVKGMGGGIECQYISLDNRETLFVDLTADPY